MTSLLLLATLAAPMAEAQDYAVQWGSEPVRYRTETVIQTPRGQAYFGKENVEGRALLLAFTMDLTCTGKPYGKNTAVACEVDSARFEGQPMSSDEERLPLVTEEYGKALETSRIEMVVAPDGRIRSLDLEGPEKGWWREARVHEVLRQLMRRAFTPLDVQVPKNGEATDKKWKYRGFPLAFELMSKTGTTGGVLLNWNTEADVAGRKMMVAEGRGNVASNADTAGSGSLAPAVNMVGVVQTLIDPAAHQVSYSEFSVDGQMSAQNVNAVGNLGFINYAGWAGRLNDDGTIETLEGPKAQ